MMGGLVDGVRAIVDLVGHARRGVGAVVAAVAVLLASIAGAVGAVGRAVDGIAEMIAGPDSSTADRSAPPAVPGAGPVTVSASTATAASAAASASGVGMSAAPLGPSRIMVRGDARQGGVMLGQVPGAGRLLLDGAPVRLGADGRFIVAFDRDAGPRATLTAVMASDGARVDRSIAVAPAAWRIEQVNAPMRGGAASDADYAARRAGELARINAARRANVESDGWRQTFIWPATGRVSGLFGSQRVYRGVLGSYHSGVDVAAGAGTPFYAPADGVVTLAATTPFTLEGHLVILDHGMGLTSAFLHAASLSVREGQRVQQGDRLGTVGATGRASGPHLHWGMKWNAARIDPMPLAGAMTRPSPAR